MNVVLTHPMHGAKIAISEKEMLKDIENGWAKHEVVVASDQLDDMNTPRRKYNRKTVSLSDKD